MKSLLDIQQEIRHLEDDIKRIVQRLDTLQNDLEEMRNATREPETDYERIEMLARQIKWEKHPLEGLQDERTCRLYLEMLLHIVRLDPEQEAAERRLAWIQGLNCQAGTGRTLEELYTHSVQMDGRILGEFAEALPETYRECFMVDALVVANLCGSANGEILEYLAGLGEILGFCRERMRGLSLLARTVLCQSLSGMERADLEAVLEETEHFGHYLEADMVQRAVEELRHVAVEIRDEEATDFQWKAKQLQAVREGDILAVYKEKKQKAGTSIFYPGVTHMEDSNQSKVTIRKAAVSGTFFRFRCHYIYYGVIGHRTDDIEAIKEWVRGGKK